MGGSGRIDTGSNAMGIYKKEARMQPEGSMGLDEFLGKYAGNRICAFFCSITLTRVLG